jgi:hypothetical protein
VIDAEGSANTLTPKTTLREGKNLTWTVAELPHRRVRIGTKYVADMHRLLELLAPTIPQVSELFSEVESYLSCYSARRHVVRATERGKKVVERIFIGQVNDSELRTDFIPITMIQVVVPDRQIEQIACGNTGRIMIIILRARSRYLDQIGSELRSRAVKGQGMKRGGPL